jgi:hypothetical protein
MTKKKMRILVLCMVVLSALPWGVNLALPPGGRDVAVADSNMGNEGLDYEKKGGAPMASAEQPPIVESYWNYTEMNVGSSTDTRCNAIVEKEGFLYAIASAGLSQYFSICKYTLEGNFLWNKSHVGRMLDFTILNENIYIIGNKPNDGDVYLVKCDLNGNEISNHTIIALFQQQGRYITHNEDDLFITFYTEYSSRTHIGLMRLHQDFSIVWNVTWNLHTENYFDTPHKILIFGDHLYLAGQMNVSAILLKFDLAGNYIDSIVYSKYTNSHFIDIKIYQNFIYLTGTNWDGSIPYGGIMKYTMDFELSWEQEIINYYFKGLIVTQYYLCVVLESTLSCGLAIYNFAGDFISIIYRNIQDERFNGIKPILNSETFYFSGEIKIGGIFYPRIVAYNITILSPPTPVMEPIGPAESDTGIINVNWSDYSAIDGYLLYRNTAPITVPNPALLIATPTESNYTDTLTANGTYYYAVVAHNSKGSSPLSANAQVEVAIPGAENKLYAPDAPTLTINTESPTTDYEVALVWTDVNGADNFTLYRLDTEITNDTLPAAAQTAQAIATLVGTTFTDIVPGPGKYYYAVVARNASGVSNLSNSEYIVVVEMTNPITPPAGEDPFIAGYPLLGVVVVAAFAIVILKRRHI